VINTYKIRMTVLAYVVASDPESAEDVAKEMVTEAGLHLLRTEEPETSAPRTEWGSREGDRYE